MIAKKKKDSEMQYFGSDWYIGFSIIRKTIEINII